MTRNSVLPSGTQRRTGDPMQIFAIALVCLAPLVPRPTFSPLAALIGPGVVVGAAALACLSVTGRVAILHRRVRPSLSTYVVFILLSSLIYASRVFASGETSEYPYVAARALLVLLAITVAYLAGNGGFDRIAKGFVAACIALSILVGFVAVTGITVLEPPLPSRALGVTLPWFKTAGVPRSYGEQAVILSILIAYVSTYWGRLTPLFRGAALAASTVILAAGQSRNMLLAAAAVLVARIVFVRARRFGRAGLVLVVAGLSTFVVEVILPHVASLPVVRGLLGEGIFEKNVYVRFSMIDQAWSLLSRDRDLWLWGITHEEWILSSISSEDVVIHNFFVASLVHLGIVAAALLVLGFFVIPLRRIINVAGDPTTPTDARLRRMFLLCASTGILIALNFYEGFFSVSLGLHIGLLWAAAGSLDLTESSPRTRGMDDRSARRQGTGQPHTARTEHRTERVGDHVSDLG